MALLGNDDGLIECKSRRQKFQVETILSDKVPDRVHAADSNWLARDAAASGWIL
jgi:hypothetical protein